MDSVYSKCDGLVPSPARHSCVLHQMRLSLKPCASAVIFAVQIKLTNLKQQCNLRDKMFSLKSF